VSVPSILEEVVRIAPSLHKAGTFSTRTLEAIARHASAAPIQHSAETGSGASTLLFSHLCPDHTVFAMDAGTGSVRAIETSPLLRRGAVTFVEGPTQVTLPRHEFVHRLQLVLIDGPHGYPFPDLEYYYLYPQLDPGALLIVDDIHIPTITNLFDVVCADEMFDLQQVVETTAFFRRTNAPTFSPLGDGWWTQRYNKRVFESVVAEAVIGTPPVQVDVSTPFCLDQFGSVTDPLRAARLEVPQGQDLRVAGWALDARRNTPASAVDLVVDGISYRSAIRVPRADVAAAYDNQAYFRSGFNAQLPALLMTPGWHQLEVRVVMDSGHEYWSAARLRFAAV